MTPEEKERKIVKDADGRQRYVDTGELVFPDLYANLQHLKILKQRKKRTYKRRI